MVELIQESSWDVVLSDLWTGAREPAGFLFRILGGCAGEDRAGSGALRPEPFCFEGKFFTTTAAVAAKLFTAGANDEEGSETPLLPRR